MPDRNCVTLYRMKAIAAAFAVLVATFCPLIAQSQKPIALVGGTLIDGTGAAPVRNSVVLIRGDRIERIGTLTSLPVPSEYERISTEGMTVLPGLWDLHVHLIYSGHPNPGAPSHVSAEPFRRAAGRLSGPVRLHSARLR